MCITLKHTQLLYFMCMRMREGHTFDYWADNRLLPFDFRKLDEWPRWLRRFEQYRVASDLSAEDEEKQVDTLFTVAARTAASHIRT